ncbi:MAG: glycosyltransferase family 2 protein, partial [Selenomonadaceae bacterium]|nr:glycosyltransferase family 2 protein [Selenomonadaceae bacterium]
MNRVALQVIIPIYHPDEKFIELLNMLKKQSIPDIPVLIIDSGSDKEWRKAAQGLNLQLKDIDSKDFN